MSVNDEQVVEDAVFEEAPAVAPVPLESSLRPTRKTRSPRPDPSFVAQLIATAEQLPQTRKLCRAAPADAMSAYRAGARNVDDTLPRTRQII
jgi:hypothetical protein